MIEITPKPFYRTPSFTIEKSWFAVSFKNNFYNIPATRPGLGSKFHKMFIWCEENCTGRWSYMEYLKDVKFYFKTSRDNVMFKLTWMD